MEKRLEIEEEKAKVALPATLALRSLGCTIMRSAKVWAAQ